MREPFPKWLILVLLAAAPSCNGCSCKCLTFDGGCDIDLGETGFGGGIAGFGGGTTTDTLCVGCDCCETDQVCWLNECLVSPSSCRGPGDCGPSRICDFSLEGYVLEATLSGGDACAPVPGLCVPQPDAAACELAPTSSPVTFATAATWGDPQAPLAEHSVVGAPAVLQLDDDNCDARVDRYDVAEIIFATAAQDASSPMHGALHAYRMRGNALEALWSTLPVVPANDPAAAIAAGRIDDGAIVVTCTEDDRIRAYDGDGMELWTGPPSARCDSLALADVDYDGVVDVVSESQVLDGLDGTLIANYGPAWSHGFAVLDRVASPAGVKEIVTANRIYDYLGTVLYDTGGADGFVGVGNDVIFGVDPTTHVLTTWSVSGTSTLQLASVDLHSFFSGSCPAGTPGELASGGPPAVDAALPTPTAGIATALGYAVVDSSGALLWAAPGLDCEAPTRGSSFFDFDGDATPEVVRYEGQNLRVHDGADGATLITLCNTVEPGLTHPLVADVDADAFGELLSFASSRAPTSCVSTTQAGVRVLRPTTPITRSRSVYNEFSYRLANTTEDGIVSSEYANVAPGMRSSEASRSAPNLIVELLSCDGGITVRVHNDGAVPVAAGQASVLFLDPVSQDDLAQAIIPATLAPGARIDAHMANAPSEVAVTIASSHGRPLGECVSSDNLLAVTCP